MDDETHVGLVDSHAEGVGGHHDARAAREPLLLPDRAFGVGQAAVVAGRGDACVAQEFGELFAAVARAHVDDTAAGHVAHHAKQLLVLVLVVPHGVGEVGPCERAAQDVRFGEAQLPHDVAGDGGCGRCRERQHRHLGQPFAQFGDAQVGGAEVVAPLRDAVRLVDGQQRDPHPLHAQTERLGHEPFGSHVEEFDIAVDAVVEHDVDLPHRKSRMDRRRVDAEPPEAVDLVLHQGDQRRDDDAQTFAQHRRHLIGERLAAAGGHQRQRVAPLADGADDLLLHGTEAVVAPVAFECAEQFGVYVVQRLHVGRMMYGASAKSLRSGLPERRLSGEIPLSQRYA